MRVIDIGRPGIDDLNRFVRLGGVAGAYVMAWLLVRFCSKGWSKGAPLQPATADPVIAKTTNRPMVIGIVISWSRRYSHLWVGLDDVSVGTGKIPATRHIVGVFLLALELTHGKDTTSLPWQSLVEGRRQLIPGGAGFTRCGVTITTRSVSLFW